MMKKTLAVLLVMGALFSGSQMYATENNNPSGKPAKIMQVSFENVSIDSKLFLKDNKGHILYTEDIETEGQYEKGFDLSILPSNDYYFEVDKKAFISIYPFTVKDDQVEFHEDLKSEIVKPVLILENDRVKLLRNLDQKQSVIVQIYDEGQNLVFRERIDKNGNIGRIYNFSEINSGEYLFSIDYEGHRLREYLSINTIN
jgi:hypothetical protein